VKRNKTKLMVFSVLASGMIFQFGCLGGWFQSLIPGLAGTLLGEFLTDNNAIFDLFPDGGTAQ